MTCCADPKVRHNKLHDTASCSSCGFRWTFGIQGKGKFKSKTLKWGPAYYCEDDYERDWRLKNYKQHEVVGKRRRGKVESYVCVCPKSNTTFEIPLDDVPDEVHCEPCDRSGLFATMLMRYRDRRGQ